MFPEWTEAKKATRWDTNWGKSADMAVEKYKGRGYTWVSRLPVSFPSVRLSTQKNGGATVVTFKPLYVEPPQNLQDPQKLQRLQALQKSTEKVTDKLHYGLNLLSWYLGS